MIESRYVLCSETSRILPEVDCIKCVGYQMNSTSRICQKARTVELYKEE